jgi:hypothetical protein
MLTAVQWYLKTGILNGLQNPMLDPLEALIQPPVLADVADHPYAYIWAGRGNERRQTAPRPIRQDSGAITPGGYQKMTWKIDVRLYTVMAQEDPNIELAFPALIDATIKELNVTQIPIIITDPVTGQQTQILTIAETLDSDYATSVTTSAEGQGIIRFGCDLTVEVQEKVSWTEGVPS